VGLTTNDLVYDPVSRLILASTSSGGGSLTTINPVAGTVGTSYVIGGSPGALVIADDGSYIHAVVDDGTAVQRFNMQTHTGDLKFVMPGQGTQYPRKVRNLYAIPERPDSVLLARYYPGLSPPADGTWVYSSGVALPDHVGEGAGTGGPDIIAINEIGDCAYGYQNSVSSFGFWSMGIDNNGVHGTGGFAWGGMLSGFNVGRIAAAKGKLFTDRGEIKDLATAASLGSFAGAGNFLLSANEDRLYSVSYENSTEVLRAYDLDTLALVGSATVTGVTGGTGSLTRFGGAGLAFRTSTQVVAVQTSLVPAAWALTGGGNWGSNINWTNGVYPRLAGETANFGESITAPATVTVASAVTVGKMKFGNTNSYTIAGPQAITMQMTGGNAMISVSSGSHAITANMLLASDTKVSVTNAAETLALNGVIGGSGALTKGGSGNVTLGAPNSYNGETRIAAGTLTVAHVQALQGSTVSLSGGTLNLNGLSATLGGLSGAGNLAVPDGRTLTVGANNADTTFAGTISGTGANLAKTGSGTLALSGSNTYSGATAINQGTLRLAYQAPAGAVARWTFDNTTADATGNGHDGTLYGGTFIAGTVGSGAVNLVGNGQWVGVPWHSAFGLNSYTVSTWVNINAPAPAPNGSFSLLGTRNGGESTFDYKVWSNGIHGDVGDGNGWISTAVDINAGDTGSNGRGGVLTPGQWYMITYAIDDAAKQMRLYIDGDLKKTIAYTGTPLFMKSGQTLGIGRANWEESTNAKLDDVYVYGRALGAAEITQLYRQAGPNANALPDTSPVSVAGNAVLDLNGNSETIGPLSGAGRITLGAGNLTVNCVAPGTPFSGSIAGTGAVVKSGIEALTLSGANTYTGPTSVIAGTLLVNSPGSLVSPVTVGDSGTLGGTGTAASVTVNSGGHIAPGNSIGTLALTGGLSLANGAKLDFELGALGSSDLISMPSSTLTLSGQQFTDFTFTPLSGFGPGTYTLIDAAGISGGLGLITTGTINGLSATLAVDTVHNDLVLNVVPEPSTLALLAVAALGHVLLTWRLRTRHT
jgi:autotransporter-associated beta strand protein